LKERYTWASLRNDLPHQNAVHLRGRDRMVVC